MQSSPFPRYVAPHSFKCLSQHPNFQQRQLMCNNASVDFTQHITESLEHSSFREANCRSASQDIVLILSSYPFGSTRWRSWLRHCAPSPEVMGSIRDEAVGIFHFPSSRIVALGSTEHSTEMSTRSIFWGVKAAGVYGWQPYHLHVPIVWDVSRDCAGP
jgi:hypothetical protein